MMDKYYKLSDIRTRLEEIKKKPISPSHAAYYTQLETFPKMFIKKPIKLWIAKDVEKWFKDYKDYLKRR